MRDLDKHYKLFDKLAIVKRDSESLAIELYFLVRNDEIFEKIGILISRLSGKNYRAYRDYMTVTIEKLRNGESPESIVADLEKEVTV